MALPVWGNLEKSQVDPEKIEEAIARLIQAHEDDPNAHVEAGESLHSHKAQEIIDHVVASIIADKIKDGELTLQKTTMTQHQIYTAFESIDGWDKSPAGVEPAICGLIMQTGGIINTVKELIAEPYGDSDALDFSKSPFFQTSVKFSEYAGIISYFMAGSANLDGTDNSFGFKIITNNLYAIHIKGDGMAQTEYTSQISGITITNWNVYRAVFDYADSKIYFYVNGVLKATHTTNLPILNNLIIMAYYIKNLIAANRILYTKYLLWSKDQ